MPSEGDSEKWRGSKDNVVNIFNVFLQKHPDAVPAKYRHIKIHADLSEEVLCDMAVYSKFGTYLCDEYTIDRGQYKGHHLSADVATNYMNMIIRSSISKCKETPTYKSELFATCVDPKSSTEYSKKLYGIKKNMLRHIRQRNVNEGEQIHKSATPMYRFQLLLIITAYAVAGTAEVRLLCDIHSFDCSSCQLSL